jgi:hypothetical protein
MAQNDDKAELILELARARAALASNAQGLRRDLDFSARAKKSFKKSPVPWLGGAAVLGLLIARIPGRSSAPAKKRSIKIFPQEDKAVEKAGKAGLVLGAMKIAFDLARPVLMRWATQRFTEYAAGHRSEFRRN